MVAPQEVVGAVATTGEMLGDKTANVGVGGFAAALDWGRSLGDERVWALEDCRHASGAFERFCSMAESASFGLRRS